MKKLEIGQPAPDFSLPATDGKDYSLGSFPSARVLVVIFTCNHCPYARAYEDRLMALQREFGPRGAQLIAINPNDEAGYPEDSFSNMVRRARERRFNFPYLRDASQRTARAYGAEYTPEAYVLDAQRRVRYIGRVDDNWQHPDQVQSPDLRRAIEAVLMGQPVPNPITHAIGCTIKWKV